MRLKHEINHAALGLKKSPGFTFILILTLTLTLGALIAAFNLNQLISFKDLPYPNVEQLYVFKQNEVRADKNSVGGQLVGAQFNAYEQGKAFSTSALISQTRGILISEPSEPMLVSLYVSAEYFELLNVPFTQGKGFTISKEIKDAKPQAVISYDLWQTQFSGRKDILGHSVQFQDDFFTIVGVMDDTFSEPKPYALYGKSQIILPIAFSEYKQNDWHNIPRNLASLIKINSTQTVAEAQHLLSKIIDKEIKSTKIGERYAGIQVKAHLTSLTNAIRGDNSRISLSILIASIILLFIAFANVVNLYLSHIAKKQHHLAICASVGATPKAIFKRLFIESFLITFISAIFALLISAWLMIFIKEIAAGTLPRLNELNLDLSALLFSFILSLFLAILLAYFGSKVVNYDALKNQLTTSGKGTRSQVSNKIRQLLIISQVCFTGLLLLATSMILQNSLLIVHKPLGINVANVISLQIDAGKKYKTPAEKKQLLEQVKNKFLHNPIIENVSKNLVSPLRSGDFSAPLVDSDNKSYGIFGFSAIDIDYFELLQQPILYGRNFNKAEITEQQKVAVISETVANSVFNKTNAVGESIRFSAKSSYKVIGITSDHFNAFTHKLYQGNVYLPLRTFRLNILLKVKPEMLFSKIEILEQLHQVDPSLRILEFLELEQTQKDLVYQYNLTAWLAGALSLLALMLACAGIYGVISYATQIRRYELGIRIALGAKHKRIMYLVIKDSFKPILMGIIACLSLAVLISIFANETLMLLGQPDLKQVVAATILLMIFSLLACILPVKKVIKADPIRALRNE